MWSAVAWAQDSAGKNPSGFEQFFPFLIIILIFYFLIIRPQSKKMKKHQQFLKDLKRGQRVLTSGGILGTIEGLTDQYVTLEVAKGVKIRILKAQISSLADEDKQ